MHLERHGVRLTLADEHETRNDRHKIEHHCVWVDQVKLIPNNDEKKNGQRLPATDK